MSMKDGPSDSSDTGIEGVDEDVVSYEAEGEVCEYFACRGCECVEGLLRWHGVVWWGMRVGCFGGGLWSGACVGVGFYLSMCLIVLME